jgi:hypothetical protein
MKPNHVCFYKAIPVSVKKTLLVIWLLTLLHQLTAFLIYRIMNG